MDLDKRQSEDRRKHLQVEFPLTDSEGVQVTADRRQGDDRRKVRATPEELQARFFSR